MNIWDFVNSINAGKPDLMKESEQYDLIEKSYNPYMVNKALSYFPDTLMQSNEMNINYSLDHKLQYQFLLNTIRPRKRFSKWSKKVEDDNLNLIKEFFGYNDKKAEEALDILSPDDIEIIRQKMIKGGKE